MKTRRPVRVLSVLLIIMLLCGLFPAAYAEGGDAAEVNWSNLIGSPATEAATELPEVIAPAPEEAAPAQAASREETMLSFLRLVMAAEAAKDPKERAQLCREAEALWNEYLESAPTAGEAYADESKDEQKLERQDMLYDLMQYIMAAETENDPAKRAALYLQADAIWYSYLGLVNSAVPPEKDPAREKALEEFLRGMTDPRMDAAEQERFIKEARKLWDTYYSMVLEAMEENKPAPAETEEAAAPQEKPAVEPEPLPAEVPQEKPAVEPEPLPAEVPQEKSAEEPKPADKPAQEEPAQEEPKVESYTFYADSWEELEDILSDFMNGALTIAPNGTPAAGIPNPWIETKWLEEAELVSGVKLSQIDRQALPEGMAFLTYRAMMGTLEADYSDGTNELMIRASVDSEGNALAGDYNSYSTMWTEDIFGLKVDCLGDGKTVNVATWKQGDVAFSVSMACGLEGQGLTLTQLRALAMHLQAEAVRSTNPMDIYADAWDYFANPFGPFAGIYHGYNTRPDGQTDGGDNAESGRTGTEFKPAPSHDRGGRRRGAQFIYGNIG